MLTAYADETGHSRDEQQKFVGMAGLLAPALNWEAFERKWKATLASKEFNIPYFHMKEFAHSKETFKDWEGNERRRRKLFGRLMLHIETALALPFGVIIPMDELRKFTKEQQELLLDPYFLCFQSVTAACTTFLDFHNLPKEEKIALVFSEQGEFKNRALQIYDGVMKLEGTSIHRSTSSPTFRDMREIVPLQAADIVAYEMYKEFERHLYKPNAETRFGYKRIVKMSQRLGFRPMFRYFTKTDLAQYIGEAEFLNKRRAYWEKRRAE